MPSGSLNSHSIHGSLVLACDTCKHFYDHALLIKIYNILWAWLCNEEMSHGKNPILGQTGLTGWLVGVNLYGYRKTNWLYKIQM